MYTVREARTQELFKYVDIFEAVHRETAYSHISVDRAKTANYLFGAIKGEEGWFIRAIARMADDEPVGGIVCVSVPALFSQEKVAYDVTIMVDEEHRGKCLKQLLQIVKEYKAWALADGAKLIKMGVSSGINMDKASAFFERMGFARVGAMHALKVGV